MLVTNRNCLGRVDRPPGAVGIAATSRRVVNPCERRTEVEADHVSTWAVTKATRNCDTGQRADSRDRLLCRNGKILSLTEINESNEAEF